MDARTTVWQNLLAADYQHRYWGRMAERLTARARQLEVITAVLSTGSVVSLLASIDRLTEVLVVVTAILNIVLANMEYRKLAALSSSFCRRFVEAREEFLTLWNEVDSLPPADALTQCKEIFKSLKLAEVSELAPTAIKTDWKLVGECQAEAVAALAPGPSA